MVRLSGFNFRLPCTERGRRIFKTGFRDGAFICLEKDGRILGAGEYAPYPGIHNVSVDEVLRGAQALANDVFDIKNLPKPLSYVLSMAHYHLELRESELAPPEGRFVKLSALVEAREIKGAVALAQNLIAQGFLTLKIKVGTLPVKDEIIKIKAIASLGGSRIKIRLDGNRQLTLSDAIVLVSSLKRIKLDYFEEPIRDPRELAQFHHQTGILLALDESFESVPDVKAFNAQVVVLKPSRFKSIYEVMTLVGELKALGVRVVLSHCFESEYSAAVYALLVHQLELDDAHGIFPEGFFKRGIFSEPLREFRGTLAIKHCHETLCKKFAPEALTKMF